MAEDSLVMPARVALALATVFRELVPDGDPLTGAVMLTQSEAPGWEAVAMPSMKKATVSPSGDVEFVEEFL